MRNPARAQRSFMLLQCGNDAVPVHGLNYTIAGGNRQGSSVLPQNGTQPPGKGETPNR
jgi:hypothetical protein